ncbi:MAG: M56 family metallopeptidase [Ruminococcaceae bacterium]|nr:M56 family metallopeptidase [Oscillospiraceae bacterium]
MLAEIFYWIFNMSISATICGVIVIILRSIKKIPRRVIHILWAIPFVRMCLPFGLSGKYGLMTLISRFTTKTVVIYEIWDTPIFTSMNFIMGAENYQPIVYKTDLLARVFAVSSLIWAILSAAIIIAFSAVYFSTIDEIKKSVLLRDNVYISDNIKSPAVYGIIRPKIVLPRGFEDFEHELILMHEGIHIKRADNLFRILGFITVSVHWFNPAAWIFLKMYLTDMELSCDEAVIARLDENEKKAYALALVSSVEKTNVFASAFGGAKIRTRIENILSYRKMSLLSCISFSVLIAAIAYILLTNAG